MEKVNKFPLDRKRRWIIATLLNIPPAYIGLTALDPIIPRFEEANLSPTAKPDPLDETEYEARLGEIWRSSYNAIDEVFVRVNLLQESLLYGTGQQKKDAAPLLCQYLLLFGNMQRARGDLSTAIAYLDRAITLSKEKDYFDVYAKALYLRGYAFYERWETNPMRGDEWVDFLTSQQDMDEAEKYSPENPALKGAILGFRGGLLARNAQDEYDKRRALKVAKASESIINASSFWQDPYFLSVNEEWYHIEMAQTYATLGWYTSAEEALMNVDKGDPHKKRRYLTMTIDEAELYIVQGKIEMGTAYAEDALMSVKDIEARAHLLRIANLYERLRQQKKYHNNPDVAHLGLELLKVRQPELFS